MAIFFQNEWLFFIQTEMFLFVFWFANMFFLTILNHYRMEFNLQKHAKSK